jgi:addiction module HigA family antidote
MKKKRIGPIHPGEFLRLDFLEPLEMSQYRLAQELKVPQVRISEIVRGKRSITADTALRLARFFGNSARFWLGIQEQYELDVADAELGKRLEREIQPFKRSA